MVEEVGGYECVIVQCKVKYSKVPNLLTLGCISALSPGW